MDLTDDGLRERLASIVTIEPDGKAWRVTLACGAQRSSIIRLSEQEACEAYAAWIREKILLPEFLALRDEARAEQQEADCKAICVLCRLRPDAPAVYNDHYQMWWHAGDTYETAVVGECKAAAIRSQR